MAIKNLGEIAEICGVSLPTVRAWVRRGCPYVEKGNKGKEWQFDTVGVIEWQKEQAALSAVGDVSTLDIEEARRRKLAAEAALSELDLSKARGELVSLEDVSTVWLEITTAARSQLLALPSKMAAIVAPLSDPAEIRTLLEAEIEEALEELSRFGESG
jgi:phage terminase Nu1 subunit (DNA packaging protein)